MFYDAFYVAGLALAKMHTWQLRCNDSTFHNAVCSLILYARPLTVLSSAGLRAAAHHVVRREHVAGSFVTS